MRTYHPPRFGTCPGCSRERRYSEDGLMLPHRVHVRGFTVNGDPAHPDSRPYGYMKPCPGSGKPVIISDGKENNASD